MLRFPVSSGLTANSGLSQTIKDMRSRIDVASQETVTGRHSDLGKHLSGRVGEAMLANKALGDLGLERGQLKLREGRLDLVQNALARVHDQTLGIETRMLSAIGFGDEADQGLIARDAKLALEQAMNTLNLRFGDRYMFSGDATDTPAFSTPDAMLADIRALADGAASEADFEAAVADYFNDPAGPFQTTVYRGTASASDPDGITGIDPAITKMISNLAVMSLADPDTRPAVFSKNSQVFENAARNAASGRDALTMRRGELGVRQEEIQRQLNTLDVEETVLTVSFNEMTARDPYEAASELRELEANLQASYLLTSRIADLSLVNYLR